MFFGCLRRVAALLVVLTAGALVGACDFSRVTTTVSPAVVGQKVRDGTFDFTVTQVTSSPTFGDRRAQGVYVIASLTVKNVGVDPEVFDRSAQLLEDSIGRRYSASFMDPPYLGDIGNSVDAGLEVNVKLAFDVPPGTKPTQIVLHESQSSDGIPVNLMQPSSRSPSPPRGETGARQSGWSSAAAPAARVLTPSMPFSALAFVSLPWLAEITDADIAPADVIGP